jgi:hypothetical protein
MGINIVGIGNSSEYPARDLLRAKKSGLYETALFD